MPVFWGLLFLLLAGVVLFIALRLAKRWYWRGVALVLGLLLLYPAAVFLLDATLGGNVTETTSECYTNGVQVPCPPNVPPSPGTIAPNGS